MTSRLRRYITVTLGVVALLPLILALLLIIAFWSITTGRIGRAGDRQKAAFRKLGSSSRSTDRTQTRGPKWLSPSSVLFPTVPMAGRTALGSWSSSTTTIITALPLENGRSEWARSLTGRQALGPRHRLRTRS